MCGTLEGRTRSVIVDCLAEPSKDDPGQSLEEKVRPSSSSSVYLSVRFDSLRAAVRLIDFGCNFWREIAAFCVAFCDNKICILTESGISELFEELISNFWDDPFSRNQNWARTKLWLFFQYLARGKRKASSKQNCLIGLDYVKNMQIMQRRAPGCANRFRIPA